MLDTTRGRFERKLAELTTIIERYTENKLHHALLASIDPIEHDDSPVSCECNVGGLYRELTHEAFVLKQQIADAAGVLATNL